jgi:hypothetical protein
MNDIIRVVVNDPGFEVIDRADDLHPSEWLRLDQREDPPETADLGALGGLCDFRRYLFGHQILGSQERLASLQGGQHTGQSSTEKLQLNHMACVRMPTVLRPTRG